MRWIFRPGIERCYLDHCTRDGIKLFLLPAPIERAPDDGKSQDLLVERHTLRRVGNHDGRMVDPQAWTVSMRRLPPARRHVVGRERDEFERMPFRIAKLERGDSSRARGQSLRCRSRDRGPARTCAQPQINGLHVGNDDGDVLESRVVAADVGRIRRAVPGECEEFDRLFAQSERERTALRALDAGQSRKAFAAVVLSLRRS